VKPAPFRYLRPRSLEEVLAALAEHGDEAKPLAGGQSLIPAMNFRLAQPSVLVDLELVEELRGMHDENGALRVGAMVRQCDAERSPLVTGTCPLLRDALPWIGHLQNRSRGTIGGSIVHADPAAELPAVAVALDANVDVVGARGARTLRATDFFDGPFSTALAPDEIVSGLRFPVVEHSAAACLELAPRRGDFAVVGVAAFVRFAPGATRVEDAGIAAFGVAATPVRLALAEASLRGADLTVQVAEAAGAASAEDVARPTADIHATGDYRRRALAELVRRALDSIASRRGVA
jgi:carbon-monoxide dehydrogenase medium subunit